MNQIHRRLACKTKIVFKPKASKKVQKIKVSEKLPVHKGLNIENEILEFSMLMSTQRAANVKLTCFFY